MGIISSRRKDQELKVVFNDDTLLITNMQGKELVFPLIWHQKLLNASAEEKENWSVTPDGRKIIWQELGVEIDL